MYWYYLQYKAAGFLYGLVVEVLSLMEAAETSGNKPCVGNAHCTGQNTGTTSNMGTYTAFLQAYK